MSETWRIRQLKRIRRQARACIKHGWSPIPIPHGQKAPRIRGWQNSRLKLDQVGEAFHERDNIGVLLGDASGGLTDVDIDCDEAIAAAPVFLPATERLHGRASKPLSHYWYVAQPTVNPLKFRDTDGTSILEIRSNGQQTLIPPSLHPSGEKIRWAETGVPTQVLAATLQKAASRLAACALIARNWPTRGSRHDFSLALAATLLRSNWPMDEAKLFIQTAAQISQQDEEWQSRQNDANSTAKRMAKGLPATGIPRLVSIVGDAVTERMVEWLGIQKHVTTTFTENTRAPIPQWPAPPSGKAFGGLLGEIVRAIEPHSEADPVALLIQGLVAFGNAIGRTAHFRVEADRHFGNLFAVLVGPTAKARKGSSWSQVARLFAESVPSWTNRCVLSGLSTGEGLIYAVRDAGESPDSSAKRKAVDKGIEDKRLLVLEPEFAQPLKHTTREGNILSTILRQAWDNGNLRTLTKTNPVQATDAHISVIGHVTQQELRKYLSQTELANGFGNRFLWTCVQRSKCLPEGGGITDEDLAEFYDRLRKAVEQAQQVSEIRKAENARKLWHDVYPVLSNGRAGLFGAITSRAEAQTMRLAMLYALLDRSRLITRKHLESALELWQYADNSARFIFGDTVGDTLADEILKALNDSAMGLTRTEISGLFAGHRSSADIERALSLLVQEGRARCGRNATGGRPDERWVVTAPEAKNAN